MANAETMNDEQKVKQKESEAVARHWGGWRDGEEGWKIERGWRGKLLGCGDTESEAWADAARRLEP